MELLNLNRKNIARIKHICCLYACCRALKTYLIISILIFSFFACDSGTSEGSILENGLYYRSNDSRGDTLELTKSKPIAPGWNLTTWELKESNIEISDDKGLAKRLNRNIAEYSVRGDSLVLVFRDRTLPSDSGSIKYDEIIVYSILSSSTESIEIVELNREFNQ